MIPGTYVTAHRRRSPMMRIRTRVAPPLYSLIESAKLAAVEPRAYLGEAAGRAIRNPATATLAPDLK